MTEIQVKHSIHRNKIYETSEKGCPVTFLIKRYTFVLYNKHVTPFTFEMSLDKFKHIPTMNEIIIGTRC